MPKEATTYVFLPQLSRASGGEAVLLRVAALLFELGYPVCLVPRERGSSLPEAYAHLALNYFDDLKLTSNDIYLCPEGWPNSLAPGLAGGAKVYVYCQNWAYLFSGLPDGVNLKSLNLKFLAVSQPVAHFIEKALGVKAHVLRPGIDLNLFNPPEDKPLSPLRVAYMPRKNKGLAGQIKSFLEARLDDSGLHVVFSEIKDLDQAGVAALLRRTHIFLATGFPEGCPLPPLEAMACGCLVTGFAGFGGFDYMRQALPGSYQPEIALREVPWGGNGLWAADNDVLSAGLNLERAVLLWQKRGQALKAMLANANLTAQAYSLEEQKKTLAALWAELTA